MSKLRLPATDAPLPDEVDPCGRHIEIDRLENELEIIGRIDAFDEPVGVKRAAERGLHHKVAHHAEELQLMAAAVAQSRITTLDLMNPLV